jgi:hypothetical protein
MVSEPLMVMLPALAAVGTANADATTRIPAIDFMYNPFR